MWTTSPEQTFKFVMGPHSLAKLALLSHRFPATAISSLGVAKGLQGMSSNEACAQHGHPSLIAPRAEAQLTSKPSALDKAASELTLQARRRLSWSLHWTPPQLWS